MAKEKSPRFTGPGIEGAVPSISDPGHDDALLRMIAGALDSGHPLDLLSTASTMMDALDARNTRIGDPAKSAMGDRPTLAELSRSLLDAEAPQTDALVSAFALLSPDTAVNTRIRAELVARRAVVPGWIRQLATDSHPYRAFLSDHILGDGENIILGVRLPRNRELTFIIYIDHNLGTVVKDAFARDVTIAEVIGRFTSDPEMTAEGFRVAELSLADVRARVSEAIENGAVTFPPFVTESWPGERPLLEWILRSLPTGGTGYSRSEFSEAQLNRMRTGFFGSDFGAEFAGDDDSHMLVDALMSFGIDYGPGDPLRWSSVAVEIVLMDWLPRKLMAPASVLSEVPRLLRAFIRYSHSVRKIPAELTSHTLRGVDQFEPAYLELITSPSGQGVASVLDGQLLHGQLLHGQSDEAFTAWVLENLALEVGGIDALGVLDTGGLPDEDFDYSDIDADIHAVVADTLALVDDAADTFFDVEFRTACRRFLRRLASVNPGHFRRAKVPRVTAATVVWIVGTVNKIFSVYGGSDVTIKRLLAHFSIKTSVSDRADKMLAGLDIYWTGGERYLGDPSVLVSAHRARIISDRDALAAGTY